jgi:hypothetical protein
MTNKEAIELLKRATMFEPTLENRDYPEAFDLAIKALEIVDDVNQKIYRNESCDRAGKCIDYIGYHCAGCNGADLK